MFITALTALLALSTPATAEDSTAQSRVTLAERILAAEAGRIVCSANAADDRTTLGNAVITIEDNRYTVEVGGKRSDAFDCVMYVGGRSTTPTFIVRKGDKEAVLRGGTLSAYHDWIDHSWSHPNMVNGHLVYIARDGDEYAVYVDGVAGPTGTGAPSFPRLTNTGALYYSLPRGGLSYVVVNNVVSTVGFHRITFASTPDGMYKGKLLYLGEMGGDVNGKRGVVSATIVWGDERRTYDTAHEPMSTTNDHVYYYAARDGREMLVVDMVEGPSFPKVGRSSRYELDGSLSYEISCGNMLMVWATWGKEPTCANE